MTLKNLNYHWKDCLDRIALKWEKCHKFKNVHFYKKSGKVKNMIVLNFTTAFHNFAIIIETGRATRVVKPILKITNVNDKYK